MERLCQLMIRESLIIMIFSNYGTSLHGKTLAGYLSFPLIIIKIRLGYDLWAKLKLI
jgi:hypothetical protein